MRASIRVGVLLAVLPLSAVAIEPGPASQYQQETENWLQLQVSGKVSRRCARWRPRPSVKEACNAGWTVTPIQSLSTTSKRKAGVPSRSEARRACRR